jgi:hypothetical protein
LHFPGFSWVEKVLDTTTINVLSACAPSTARSRSTGSMFAHEAHVQHAVAEGVRQQPRAEVGAARAEVDDSVEGFLVSNFVRQDLQL